MADSVVSTNMDDFPEPPRLAALRTWCRHCACVLSTTGTLRSLSQCPECGTSSTEDCPVETNTQPSPQQQLKRLILLYQNKIRNHEHVNKYLLPKQF